MSSIDIDECSEGISGCSQLFSNTLEAITVIVRMGTKLAVITMLLLVR